MKNRVKSLTVAVSLMLITLNSAAQTGVETVTPYGHGEDSIRCLNNTSLYSTCFDNKDFAMAMRYWRQVVNECPASSENIYIRGESMCKELYRITGDKAYIDTVLMILTQRTNYFNDKPSNDLRKSLALYELGGNDSVYTEQCYRLIKEVADSFPDQIDHSYSVLLMAAASKSFSLNLIDTSEVVAACSKATGIVETRLEINPDDSRYADAAERIETIFQSSGAMTCKSIEELYSRKVFSNIRDTALIAKVFKMLRETGCNGSDFHYNISTRMYANDRSADNAIRLAELNIIRKNTDKAVWYYTDAFKLDTNKVVQSDILTRVASMELASGKRQEARNHGELAYELNNKNGKALLVIADAYAGSKIGDAFDNHSVYWVAVDYLKNARSIDPSLKAITDEKIKAWSKLFPTKEEGFYRGILDEGVVHRVGGWINEVTIIRFRKE